MKLEDQVVSKRVPWNKGKTGYHMPLRGGGYDAIHRWLRKHYGNANRCEEQSCSMKSDTYHWAKLPDLPYEHKRENFVQLCASCHRKLDYTRELQLKHGERLRGRKLTATHKSAISQSLKETLAKRI